MTEREINPEALASVETSYRLATAEDINEVLALIDRISEAMDANTTNPKYVPVPQRGHTPERADAFMRFIDNQGSFILIGEKDDSVASMAAVTVCSDMRYGKLRAVLDHIAVGASYERSGEAKSMVGQVIDMCRKKGVNDIKLPCGNDFPHIRKMYERLGGVGTGTITRIPISE